ncbi:MAG: hypothetical protein ABIA78_03200 [archaeon]
MKSVYPATIREQAIINVTYSKQAVEEAFHRGYQGRLYTEDLPFQFQVRLDALNHLSSEEISRIYHEVIENGWRKRLTRK